MSAAWALLVMFYACLIITGLCGGMRAQASEALLPDLHDEVDNSLLPLGHRVAILISGLWESGFTDRWAIPSMRSHVMRPLTRSGVGEVHFFVHSEPEASSNMTLLELENVWSEMLGSGLKGIFIKPGGVHRTEGRFSHGQYRQFNRIRELFDMVLGHEVSMGARYSHVIRMRTDAIWVQDLPSYSDLVWAVPAGKVAAVPERRVQKFTSPHGLALEDLVTNVFWISSRANAWWLTAMMPVLLMRSIDQPSLASVLQCQDSQMEKKFSTVDDQNEREQMLKKTQKACSDHVLRADRGVTDEALFSYLLHRHVGPANILDSCAITGDFWQGCSSCTPLHETMLYRPCHMWDEWRGPDDPLEIYMAEIERILEEEQRKKPTS